MTEIEQVRTLHAPSDDLWPKCQGCDADGWEAEYPEWPCRTADLVYTPEEITQITQETTLRRDERLAERAAERANQPQEPSLIQTAYAKQISEQLTQPSVIGSLLRKDRSVE